MLTAYSFVNLTSTLVEIMLFIWSVAVHLKKYVGISKSMIGEAKLLDFFSF